MAVLTWQNVDGPRSGYGAPSISDALQAVNNGFNALQNTAKMYRDDSIANFDNQKAQNTGALINSLANINSIDDLDKHIASGAFNADALKQQFGGAVDLSALNDALMKRRGQIQTDADNQLKLNANTDFQAHAPELQQAAALASKDPDAFRAYMAQHNFGAGAAQALEQLMPYMNATREDATAQRGQSLSYAAQMANVALNRDKFNWDKSQATKLTDRQDMEGAAQLGQNAAIEAAKTGSENDGSIAFHKSKEYLALNNAQKAAADSTFNTQFSRSLQLTDAQQKQQQADTLPVQQQQQMTSALTKQYDEVAKRRNPLFGITTGSENLADKPMTELTKIASQGVSYDKADDVTNIINRTMAATGLSAPEVVSIMQNSTDTSMLRFWGLGREGNKYDEDKVLARAKDYAKYKISGQEDQDVMTRQKDLNGVATGMQKANQLSRELAQLRANGKDTSAKLQELAQQKAENDRMLQTLSNQVGKNALGIPGADAQQQQQTVTGLPWMSTGLASPNSAYRAFSGG